MIAKSETFKQDIRYYLHITAFGNNQMWSLGWSAIKYKISVEQLISILRFISYLANVTFVKEVCFTAQEMWYLSNIFSRCFDIKSGRTRYALRKKTILFGNFSQTSGPPPPHPPLLGTPYPKFFLVFILYFRPSGTFSIFTKKLKFCQYFYIYFCE